MPRSSLRLFVFTAIVGLCLSPLAGAQIVLPAPELSVVRGSSDEIGLRARYSASAFAPGDFEAQNDSLTKLPVSWTESISVAGSVAALDPLDPDRTSSAEFQGRVNAGRLSGKTGVAIENGPVSASTFVYMQFMDVLQVDSAGILHHNWKVTGTADAQRLPFPYTSTPNFAASRATAELFIWPFGTFPTTGLPFEFTVYAKSSVGPSGETHILPRSYAYEAGSRWWMLGQILIESNASSNDLLRLVPPHSLQSTADLRHTAELSLTPDASTPDASFHSASGFDYRVAAIPEPSTYLLFFAGMGALAVRRRLRPLPT
jgi:hypothetical protein